MSGIRRTVACEARVRFEERRSVFHAACAPVVDEAQAVAFLGGIRAEFPDATHHVPAWILGGERRVQKHSDDGEPQGTAGLPVLEALLHRGIEDACIVVVRYYGGVQLGTGGLVRAYGQAASLAVEAAGVLDVSSCGRFRTTVRYADLERVQRGLRAAGTGLLDLACGIDAEFTALVPHGGEDAFQRLIGDLTAGAALVEPLGSAEAVLDAEGVPVRLLSRPGPGR
jgi:uncharacterized YigZ family protein